MNTNSVSATLFVEIQSRDNQHKPAVPAPRPRQSGWSKESASVPCIHDQR